MLVSFGPVFFFMLVWDIELPPPNFGSISVPTTKQTVPTIAVTKWIRKTATPGLPPTRRLTVASKSATSGCYRWSDITLADVGKSTCVTGQAQAILEDEMATYIKFGQRTGQFYIVSYDWYFPDVRKGTCVIAKGTIEKLGASPVIVSKYSDHLYNCNQ